jgi:hypothetical protein
MKFLKLVYPLIRLHFVTIILKIYSYMILMYLQNNLLPYEFFFLQ